MKPLDCVVVGAGAAGFFAALAAKATNTNSTVVILEKTNQFLAKVRISGGGRCNVTHHCFDPRTLVKNYPRGHKALLGPLMRFQPQDTFDWFQTRGVELKVEPDGRVFPTTDQSQTIIDCLVSEANRLGIELRKQQHIKQIRKDQDRFEITLIDEQTIHCHHLILATGSNPQGYQLAQSLGHTLVPPVPSLFTFNIPDSPLTDLAGISLPNVQVKIKDSPYTQAGPILITHWGFSGPAVLKLSAWGARFLHEKNYHVEIAINWLGDLNTDLALAQLISTREAHPSRTLAATNPFGLPKNLWKRFLELLEIEEGRALSGLGNALLKQLATKLTADLYLVKGKTTNKEEFVTCGGVNLDEVNFKTLESRCCQGLYFAGEILDIDGITGGFNFQNAWTTGWIAGSAVKAKSDL